MVDFNHTSQWFYTAEGITEFGRITTLEERILFIQAFLEKTTDEAKEDKLLDYEREDIKKKNFRFALFLADAIYGSVLPYSKYPAIIDENQNPFFKRWKEAQYGKFFDYPDLSLILQKENNNLFNKNATPSFKESLISENVELSAEKYGKRLFVSLPDTTIFDVDPSLKPVQQKIMCLFKDIN